MFRTVRLSVQYDGGIYFGFQKQKKQISIQQTLEEALSDLLGQKIRIRYAGRTDAGVNAKEQVIAFDDNNKVPLSVISKTIDKIDGLHVISIDTLNSKFDPRRDAVLRIYEYWFYEGEKNVFFDKFMLNVAEFKLDYLKNIICLLVGEKDCVNLCKDPAQYKTTVREILDVQLHTESQEFLGYKKKVFCFRIVARSYMYHMVRKIVGLILELNIGKLSKSDFTGIINGTFRKNWKMAPAKGLYLSKVEY